MRRDFTGEPVAPGLVDQLLDDARRAPSAGNSQATAFVVLEGPQETARYWDVTLPVGRRASFRWPGLLRAPVLVVVLTSPDAYVARYAEQDKAATGLGGSADAWTVPYWWVDAGMVVQNLLLGIGRRGLGACFFGLFDHEEAVLAELGVPDGWRAVGTVAFGVAAPDEPGRSSSRPRPPLDAIRHRSSFRR